MSAIAGLLVWVLAGAGVTAWLWPRRPASTCSWLAAAATAAALGVALSSVTHFTWLAAHAGTWAPLRVIDVALLVVALGLATWRVRSGWPEDAEAPRLRPAPRLDRLALIGLCLAAGLSLVGVWGLTVRMPHGEWDAWAMWNLKARFLESGGLAWRRILVPGGPGGHRDYPLLVPLTVARGWHWAESHTLAVPHAVALGFAALSLGLLLGFVGWLRGAAQGCLAAAALAATPLFVDRAGSQYADTAVGCYLLLASGLVAVGMHDRSHTWRWWLLTGMAAGAAAWTKNEGAAFALVLLPSAALVSTARRGWAAGRSTASGILLGILPFVLCVAALKAEVGLGHNVTEIAGNASDGASWEQRRAALLAPWRILPPMMDGVLVKLVIAYALLAGLPGGAFRGRGRWCWALLAAALPPMGAVVAGYYSFYLFKPDMLILPTSLPRMVAQLWPSALLLLFLVVRSPAEVLRRARAGWRMSRMSGRPAGAGV